MTSEPPRSVPRPKSMPASQGAVSQSNAEISDLIADILTALLRSWPIVILCVVAAIALAVLQMQVRVQTYEAFGRVVIDQSLQANRSEQRIPNPMGASMAIDSEVESLQSRDLLAMVGEELNAAGVDAQLAIDPDDDYVTRQESIDALLRGLTVERVNSTYVIDIRFEAESADVAAQVVNLLIEEFRLWRQDVLVNYVQEGVELLQRQIEKSDAELALAERRVEEFRTEFQVESSADQGVLEQELAETLEGFRRVHSVVQELNNEIDAIERAVDAGDDLTVTFLRELAAITSVETSRLLDPVQDLQQLVATGGDRARRDVLVNEIASTLRGYLSALEDRRNLIETTARALERKRANLGAELSEYRRNLVDLRGLERQAAALEARHIGLLEQFQEIRGASSLEMDPVRVLQRAAPPLQPSGMGPKVLLAIATVAGLMAGIGVALLREQIDGSFKSSRSLETVTGTPSFGSIPNIGSAELRRAPNRRTLDDMKLNRRQRRQLKLFSYGVRFTDSRCAKTLERSIFEIEKGCSRPATVAIMSALWGEGKSFFCSNLGFMLAARGRRVLMVDVDEKNHGLSDTLGPVGTPAENDFEDELAAHGAEMRRITDNLYAICRKGRRSTDMVAMAPLISKIQKAESCAFDVTLLDTPPLAYLPESLELVQLSAASILIVKWGQTHKSLLGRLLAQNPEVASSLIGTVFSQAEPVLLDRYEHIPNSQRYYFE